RWSCPTAGPGIDASRRLRESRGERTLLQMRSHLRDHRGRHLARHPARARVDSRQPLQLAPQLQSVVNYLFPHGIEPARWRAVRITKNPANGSTRRMTEKPEVLHFGLVRAAQPAKQAVEFADSPQAPFENSLMGGKGKERRVDRVLESSVQRPEVDPEQFYQQVPIFVSLERIESRFGVKMAGDPRFEAADEARRQKIIVRHHVGRQVREISARKSLLLGSAGRTEQSESRAPVVRVPAQTALQPAPLHD